MLPEPVTWMIRDADGDVMPWLTHPALSELDAMDLSGRRVFEWGAGHSTLWWAKRAAAVVIVEHNLTWALAVAGAIKQAGRSALLHIDQEAEYIQAVRRYLPKFEVIVVDGIHREACVREAVGMLQPGGLLIVDNVEWPELDACVGQLLAGWERHRHPQPDHGGDPQWTTDLYRAPKEPA